MGDLGNGIGANRGPGFHFGAAISPAGENRGHMCPDGRGHVVMVVTGHDRAVRVALRHCNCAQQVARVGFAYAEAVAPTHGHEPFFQIKDTQYVARGGNGFVGADGHVPTCGAQVFQHAYRAGKGAGQVGGMRGVIGHVPCRGLLGINAGGGRTGMDQQTADKGCNAIANHGADLFGGNGRQAVMGQKPVGAGRQIGEAVDQRAVHIENGEAGRERGHHERL